MAVFTCPRLKQLGRRRSVLIMPRKKKQPFWPNLHMKVKCSSSSSGNESNCVVVKENYIKAGGSQFHFVQMQQNKDMDQQSKLPDKEWAYIPVGGSLPNSEQKTLAFGASASMVHLATGLTSDSEKTGVISLFDSGVLTHFHTNTD
ncbi:hypothetical protein HAX54_027881 [Datura stramonium]|uniref:Uncharacterized protein n=1 Tax=Datura stramonium TaxID=4076 RepID=A0ABS8S927_DATST|nr:hypothetical protein [Datura stramonium]